MTGFPIYRPRRLRATENLRSLIRETSLSVKDLIFPLFVVPGENVKNEIETLKRSSRAGHPRRASVRPPLLQR